MRNTFAERETPLRRALPVLPMTVSRPAFSHGQTDDPPVDAVL